MAFLFKKMPLLTTTCSRWRVIITFLNGQPRWLSSSQVDHHSLYWPCSNFGLEIRTLVQSKSKEKFNSLCCMTTYSHFQSLADLQVLSSKKNKTAHSCFWQHEISKNSWHQAYEYKRKGILQNSRIGDLLFKSNHQFHSLTSLCAVDKSPEPLAKQEDLHELTRQLLEETSKLDVMIKSVPIVRAEQVVLNLHNCGFNPEEIFSIIAGHPKYFTSNKLVPCIHSLLNQGLLKVHVVAIVQNFDPIISLNVKKIEDVINIFRSFGFYEKSFSHILAACPAVFLLEEKAISQKIQMVKGLFTNTDAVRVLRSCPNILLDEWADVQAKFDYVFHTMKVSQKQMMYASLFNHSLQHVKNRHMFLVHAGFFDMSKIRENEKSSNDSLDKIIDTTEEDFCRRFGGFSVEEYRTFCKLNEKKHLMDPDEEM